MIWNYNEFYENFAVCLNIAHMKVIFADENKSAEIN